MDDQIRSVPEKRKGSGVAPDPFVCAPAGCEIYISLEYKNYTFEYVYPLSGKSISPSAILDLSVDGRSMWLCEGEANGAFNLRDGNMTIRATITPDDDGKFSVLLPETFTYNYLSFGNGRTNTSTVYNTTLTKLTHLPDMFEAFTTYQCMFKNCTALEEISCRIPGRGRSTSAWMMFQNCSSLRVIPDFETSNITNFTCAFYGCSALLKLPYMDTSKGTSFSYTFSGCTSITEVPFYDTSSGTDFSYMFFGCTSLESEGLPLLDTSKGTTFNRMFSGCSKLTTIPLLDTSNGTDFTYMFYQTSSLETIPLLNTSKGTTFSGMFRSSGIKVLPEIDTSSGTAFSEMFNNATRLQTTGLLDTHGAKSFSKFQYNCYNLEAVNITSTENVTTFANAWNNCKKIKEIPACFDPTKATDMSSAFAQCVSITSVPSLSYPVCTEFSMTFADCINLETIGEMDTPVAQQMYHLFYGCKKLKASPLRNTSTVTSSSGVFYSTGSLTDFTNIDLSSTTSIQRFFYHSGLKNIPYLNTASCTNFTDAVSANFLTWGGCDMSAATVDFRIYHATPTYIGPLDGAKVNINIAACVNLTHQSLIDIMTSLGDVTEDPKALTLGDANLAKLTEEEKAIATDKGWTLAGN